MMNQQDTKAQAILGYIETALLNGRAIAHDEELLLSGLLDSLAVASLVAEAERVGGIKIPPQDVTITNFTTVDTIVAYIEKAGPK
jgi:acyl carrier protein